MLEINQVELNLGITLGGMRRAAMCETLAADLTRAELVESAELLKTDVALSNTVRFKGTLTPGDFRRVLGDGCHSKLYTWGEAITMFDKFGGSFTDYFEPIPIAGRKKPMWRRI